MSKRIPVWHHYNSMKWFFITPQINESKSPFDILINIFSKDVHSANKKKICYALKTIF